MENNCWQYTEGKCKKCRSNKIYLKEVPGKDYTDRLLAKSAEWSMQKIRPECEE
jgi:hypothetical protein